MMRKAFAVTMVCGLSAALANPAAAQSAGALPAILGDPATVRAHYLPDFSYAGYEYGAKPLPRQIGTVIDVRDYGAIPDDDTDDSQALRAAIAAAAKLNAPATVQLEAGRYLLSDILWIESSGIVLAGKGDGPEGTVLYMPRPLRLVNDGGALDEVRVYLRENDKIQRDKKRNINNIFSEYSWSGGFIWVGPSKSRPATYLERLDTPVGSLAGATLGTRGERTVTVADASKLKVGSVVQLLWFNRAGETGPLIREIYGDTDLEIGSRHWELPDRPLVKQQTRIDAIDGNAITIADPLLHDISEKLPATVAGWRHLSHVGLRDFAMEFPTNPYFGHHLEDGYNGVYFTGVHNGWIENVRILNSDSGILTDDIANVTIRKVTTEGKHKAHYSVHIGNVHNVLVDGLTVSNPVEHALSFNTQATRSVYANSTVTSTPTLDQHAGANHQNLYDNLTLHVKAKTDKRVEGPMVDLYRAGGAKYWLPGHGAFNTHWNVNLVFDERTAMEEITILGDSEGPNARIVGMHGNRPLKLEYSPAPYVEAMNEAVSVPSLYEWQLRKRVGSIGQQPR